MAKSTDIHEYQSIFSEKVACTVIAVSGGYPEAYEKGKAITLSKSTTPDQLLFHAGTKMVNHNLVTAGGRVLECTGLGNTIDEALKNSYNLIDSCNFDGMNFRSDIGKDLMQQNDPN